MNKKTLFLSTVFVSALLLTIASLKFVPQVQAATTNITVTADSWVSDDLPDTNFGGGPYEMRKKVTAEPNDQRDSEKHFHENP